MSRCTPQQQPGLFRADREHRRPGAGPCILARNLRDAARGRRSEYSKNPSKPELAPVNAARGTSRHRRRNDRVRDSVRVFAFEVSSLTIITANDWVQLPFCTAAMLKGPCPLWVKSRHRRQVRAMSALPLKA